MEEGLEEADEGLKSDLQQEFWKAPARLTGGGGAKMVHKAGLVDGAGVTQTTCDLVFSRSKGPAEKRLAFSQFLEALVQLSARRFPQRAPSDAFRLVAEAICGYGLPPCPLPANPDDPDDCALCDYDPDPDPDDCAWLTGAPRSASSASSGSGSLGIDVRLAAPPMPAFVPALSVRAGRPRPLRHGAASAAASASAAPGRAASKSPTPRPAPLRVAPPSRSAACLLGVPRPQSPQSAGATPRGGPGEERRQQQQQQQQREQRARSGGYAPRAGTLEELFARYCSYGERANSVALDSHKAKGVGEKRIDYRRFEAALEMVARARRPDLPLPDALRDLRARLLVA
eukprot:m51a1_g14138 putative tubulin polymerization-promoting protein (343) ;mRNA; r:241522-242810